MSNVLPFGLVAGVYVSKNLLLRSGTGLDESHISGCVIPPTNKTKRRTRS